MADIFRQKYRELNDTEKREMENIKTLAEELRSAIQHNTKAGVPDPEGNSNGREMALATTKLEECIMWAVKGLTK